jgi:hypothetical protein
MNIDDPIPVGPDNSLREALHIPGKKDEIHSIPLESPD